MRIPPTISARRPARRWPRSLGLCLSLLASALLVGCGTTADVLVPGLNYTDRAGDYRAALVNGNSETLRKEAESALGRADNRDGVLYALEAARLQSLTGDRSESIRTYQEATDIFDRERNDPTFSVARSFFSATALATNDLAIPYRTESYERLMAYNYLALDFLATGDMDSAQIALNAADAEQSYLREREGDLLSAAQDRARQQNIGWSQPVAGQVQRLQVDRTVLEPYQSALSYYLSGLLFEARGDSDRAAIVLQQAAALLPRNPYIDGALAQLPRRPADRSARVVVVSSDGLISARSTVAVPFVWNGVILQVALPTYDAAPPPVRPLELRTGENSLGTTAVIANLDGQARKDLASDYPAIFVRQVMRLVAKYQSQQQLARENPWAGLAAQLFNLLTDKADQRGWLTLPAYIQTGHFDLAPGAQTLTFPGVADFDLDLPPGSITFILLTRAGGQTYQDVVTYDASGVALAPPPVTSNESP